MRERERERKPPKSAEIRRAGAEIRHTFGVTSLDPTVEEVCALILSAQNAVETTQPVNAADELNDEEDEDINPAPPPAFVPTSTSTRLGRTTRPPTRYSGSHWVAY
ncbi:hypothetical protein RhiJN_08084 [Ceratobasidium sp. AG-Ba]|nr:hypothetical protein RhiJN_08084 [Ceratobasidium sp. AG-Ba]